MSQWEQMTKTQLINELEARGIWLERLGAIVDGSRDAVFISDEDARFMLVNSAACELTGYSEDELLEMRIPDLHDEEDLHAYNDYHAEIMDGQDAMTEADILRKDGTKVTTEFSNRRIVIAGTLFMHTVARDITERKRTAEALRLMSVITYQVSDAVVATDLDFKITFVNRAFEDLYGYTGTEVLGRVPDFLNADADTPRIQEDLFKTVSGGREWRRELRNKRKDGSTFPCELTVVPLFDDDGQIFAYAGSQRDITERKRTEEQLRLLSVITLQVSDSVIATDLDFKIIFMNEAFEELYGYSSSEALGRTPEFVNAEPMAPGIQKEIYETVSSGREWRNEVLNRRKDGSTFPCEVSVFPLADEEGRIFAYAGTQRDISQRKRSEEEREGIIAQLRAALRRTEELHAEESGGGTADD